MSLGIVFDSILLQVTINLTSISFLRLAVPETYGTSLVHIHDVVSVQQTCLLLLLSASGFLRIQQGGAREYDWFNSMQKGWGP